MICPRCGAENQPIAKLCRMCATPLEAAAAPAVITPKGATANVREKSSVSPTPAPPLISPPQNVSSPGPGEILCSVCKAVNDASWAYCQQCGSPLRKQPAQPATSVPKPLVPPPPPPPPPPHAIQRGVPPAPPRPIPEPPKKAPENLLRCQSCNSMNAPGSSFCASCGAALPPEHLPPMRSATAIPRLRLIQEGGGEGEIYNLTADETIIGRNSGNILFPHDGYMSGRHAKIVRKGDKFILIDEGSRNGTFKRIDKETELKSGDIILIGKQLFRFEM
ncbi:MAG: zinc ribbon domain-containing protein [Acidobacteriota bacterium]|nr:zinc ribbon domain-containing protein [Blastocatellia bacterium]MDW8413796.1 zinc ribbon domain-containing protein [Acidobacteriota bacterium]